MRSKGIGIQPLSPLDSQIRESQRKMTQDVLPTASRSSLFTIRTEEIDWKQKENKRIIFLDNYDCNEEPQKLGGLSRRSKRRERSDPNPNPSIEMLFQVGGQGARPTFFEMAAAQQLPASLRAALTYSLGVPPSSLASLPSLGFFYRRVCSSMKLGFR